MHELSLFPAEDTTIKCNKPDGTSIQLDVIELEDISHSLFENPGQSIPYVEYLGLMCKAFSTKYGYSMSMKSMSELINVKNKILDNIKKNIHTQLESANSTE